MLMADELLQSYQSRSTVIPSFAIFVQFLLNAGL